MEETVEEENDRIFIKGKCKEIMSFLKIVYGIIREYQLGIMRFH